MRSFTYLLLVTFFSTSIIGYAQIAKAENFTTGNASKVLATIAETNDTTLPTVKIQTQEKFDQQSLNGTDRLLADLNNSLFKNEYYWEIKEQLEWFKHWRPYQYTRNILLKAKKLMTIEGSLYNDNQEYIFEYTIELKPGWDNFKIEYDLNLKKLDFISFKANYDYSEAEIKAVFAISF